MKTFITIKDGCIDDIRQQNESPGENWQEVPNNSEVSHGVRTDWYDKNWRLLSDEALVAQGKRTDDRGYWYNKETREEKYIGFLDQIVDRTLFTRAKPIADEPYQEWDEQTSKWVVDVEKKEIAKKESELAEVKRQIEDAEKRIIRPLRAINANRATQDDRNTFDEYDALIEGELRPKLKQLEAELKSA
jgi:hypothetical protein